MAANEDIPYLVDDFATPDKVVEPDEDMEVGATRKLREANEYLTTVIAEHNTLDVIDATEAHLDLKAQTFAHKWLVGHLRAVQNILKGK